MQFEEEKFFTCPHCFQNISMLLEEIEGSQSYIEDCEVCCRPIQVHYVVEDGQIISLDAQPA